MVRLTLLVIFLALSLLTFLKAPEFHLWMLAIVVSEYCWIFALIVIVLLLAGFVTKGSPHAGTAVGCAALLFLLSPIFRAYAVSSDLSQDLDKAFGMTYPAKKTESPFSLVKLFGKGTGNRTSSHTFIYSARGKENLDLDFYSASQAGERPCVIVIHGGSWKSGDKLELPELNVKLASCGFHVASINYRLAPEFHATDVQEDVRDAISWVRANAARLQVDSTQLVLLGRSAGAQIALLAAYTTPDPAIRGVVDFYGPADMVWGYSVPSNPWIMDSRKVMSDYLGGIYQKVPEAFAKSSPLLAAAKHAVPTLIIHGANDVLVSPVHSERLDRLLADRKVPHYYLRLPWATHGFDYNLNGPGGQLSTYAVCRFVKAVTHPL